MNYSKLNQVVNRVISENDGLCIRLKENGHQEPKQYFTKHEEQEFEFLISVMWRIQICLRNGLSRKQKKRLHYLIQIYTISLLIKLNECAVFGNVHHIIMDGLSIQIFTEQIAKYYYDMHNENEEGEIKIHMFNF